MNLTGKKMKEREREREREREVMGRRKQKMKRQRQRRIINTYNIHDKFGEWRCWHFTKREKTSDSIQSHIIY